MLDYFSDSLRGDREPMVVWKERSFRLELFWRGRNVGYRFYDRDRLIFEGDDFRPSQLFAVDGPEAVRNLLAFLSARPGDADEDYFAGYTQEQLDWVIENGEELWWLAEGIDE